MNGLRMFLTTCVAMTLAACGGGGGGSTTSPPPPPPPPPPSDAVAGGHWFGTVTNEFSAVTEEYIAMVDENGRFRLVSVDSAVQFSGNFLITGNALAGDAMAFADAGVVWLDSNSATPATFAGTIVERNTMTGNWSMTDSAEFGTFEFFYDPTFYERAATLAMLAGLWTAYDELLNPVVTFTIAADGSFSGQNAQGCNSIGQFAVIDPGFNLYEVQSTISDCSIAGSYVGLAFLADLFVPNDALIFAIDNGSRAIALGFEK